MNHLIDVKKIEISCIEIVKAGLSLKEVNNCHPFIRERLIDSSFDLDKEILLERALDKDAFIFKQISEEKILIGIE